MIKLLLIFFVCSVIVIEAQDINKVIFDEITEKPMLIGFCNRSAFQDSIFSGWFNSEYINYEVAKDEIGEIIDSLKITIVMGTWCSDSRREVPRFYKILDYLRFPNENITLINVNRQKRGYSGEVDDLSIAFVPTFIFYNNNVEIGRIIETPQESLELDFNKIVINQ